MTIITPTGIAGITSITSTGNTLQFQNASGNAVNVSGVNVTSGTDINVSGIVTASAFVGNLSGNVTGNVSGTVNSTGLSTFSGGIQVGATTSIVIGDTFIKRGSVGLGTTDTTGRNAGVGTATGTIIYNSSTGLLEYYNGGSWTQLRNNFDATGGTKTTAGGKTIHTFTGSGTFTVNYGSAAVDYLVVAGGGAGASDGGTTQGNGGGGAGALRYATGQPVSSTPGVYIVTIGAGGQGGLPASGNDKPGTSSSIAFPVAVTAPGGGSGGYFSSQPGGSGGSGGGGGAAGGSGGSATGDSGGTANSSSPTSGWGNGGASGSPSGGGGGGGASAAGSGRTGGNGLAYSISGTSVTYAGGGGASGPSPGPGGSGGGGNGVQPGTGGNGTVNTGGGGGGGLNANGGGGSGVVIIAYPS